MWLLSDYDGNGIADRTIYSAGNFHRTLNPGGGAWSTNSDETVGVGLGDASFVTPPFVGDFDGDGVSDNIALTASTVFARLSTNAPPWSDSLTVQGNLYGDPSQDTSFFVGDFNLEQFLLAPLKPGDYNSDGTVDAADLRRLRDNARANWNCAGRRRQLQWHR